MDKITYIVRLMKLSSQTKLTITTGLALFAMFFGAGNMVFPIQIGAEAGHHLFAAWAAFIFAGVGIPFGGLFIVSLYKGDYWHFFKILSKPVALVIVTFIILLIGPLFAAPRTADITFRSLQPFLPAWENAYLFNLLYFALVFLASYNPKTVMDLIGKVISPLKLIALTALIVMGLSTMHPLPTLNIPTWHVFNQSLSIGYGTMDLLATYFFGHIAYRNVVHKCELIGIKDTQTKQRIILRACGIGAVLITLIYTGFMLAANGHAQSLANTPTAGLITELALEALGQYGSVFVGLCVAIACLGTAIALSVVSTNFFYTTLLRRRIPKTACLLLVLSCMYAMSILGFDGIMQIASPILNVLYPSLIIFSLINLWRYYRHRNI
jgi:LIVCS family branched-chain amino acid:cation transporter